MTRTVKYTDRFEAHDSAVIQRAWYNTHTKELFVELLGGAVCGYADVPTGKWEEFALADSHGRYWNFYIRNNYTGIDGDVKFVPYEEVKHSYPQQVSKNTNESGPGTTVFVKVDGVLKFNVPEEDIIEAMQKVQRLIDKSLDSGISVITKVEVNDKGN